MRRNISEFTYEYGLELVSGASWLILGVILACLGINQVPVVIFVGTFTLSFEKEFLGYLGTAHLRSEIYNWVPMGSGIMVGIILGEVIRSGLISGIMISFVPALVALIASISGWGLGFLINYFRSSNASCWRSLRIRRL